MTYNKRKVGQTYEQAVGEYLSRYGYEIIRYNYRCPIGEIDIIAKEGKVLVFCEVKYRKTNQMGDPLEAVTRKKQQIIFQCAQYYLMITNQIDMPCRFDVIGILDDKIEHVQDAFGVEI